MSMSSLDNVSPNLISKLFKFSTLLTTLIGGIKSHLLSRFICKKKQLGELKKCFLFTHPVLISHNIGDGAPTPHGWS